MLAKLKKLIPANESSVRFSYAMLVQQLDIPKSEIRRQLHELQELNLISIDGNEITIINNPITKRCIIPDHIKTQVYAKFKNKCAYCGDKLTEETRTIDHIIPLSQGGANLVSNFFPACTQCNSLKSSESLSTFKTLLRVEQFYFEKLMDTTLF